MNKILYATCLLMLTIVFTACPSNYEVEHIYLDDLTEDVRAKIPYQQGDVVKLLHENNRTTINFTASRELINETENEGFYNHTKVIHYQYDIVKLTPDYPLFDINLSLCNYSQYGDEEYEIMPHISMGNETFRLDSHCIMVDTLTLNDKEYYSVMKAYITPDDSSTTSFDTLFYNYEYGILQIKMKNGETYTYIDEE